MLLSSLHLHSSLPFIKLACQCKCGKPFSDLNLRTSKGFCKQHMIKQQHVSTSLIKYRACPSATFPCASRSLTASDRLHLLKYTKQIQPMSAFVSLLMNVIETCAVGKLKSEVCLFILLSSGSLSSAKALLWQIRPLWPCSRHLH